MPNLLMQEFKDDATAFNAKKKGKILNKGIINCALTDYIFKFLGKGGIRTHLVETISGNEMIVKKLSIIPIEVVVRNIAAGSLLKKTNLTLNTTHHAGWRSNCLRTTRIFLNACEPCRMEIVSLRLRNRAPKK